MQRIAVTVTAKENSFQRYEPLPSWTRPAWLSEAGFLDFRDCPEGGPTCSGYLMDPPPCKDSQEWHRYSANHGTILAPQGGRGFIIKREPGAVWQDA